jgi:hypothetical protein
MKKSQHKSIVWICIFVYKDIEQIKLRFLIVLLFLIVLFYYDEDGLIKSLKFAYNTLTVCWIVLPVCWAVLSNKCDIEHCDDDIFAKLETSMVCWTWRKL